MFLKDILAISGYSGLFMYIKQGRNGIIVEGLEDKKRMNAHSTAKISSLEDITIFSEGDKDIPLEEIIIKIFEKENSGPCINHKSSNEELKSYFQEVLPEYDKDRVYVSDIKKVIMWYNILQKLDLIKIEEKEEKEEKEDEKEKPAPKIESQGTKKADSKPKQTSVPKSKPIKSAANKAPTKSMVKKAK